MLITPSRKYPTTIEESTRSITIQATLPVNVEEFRKYVMYVWMAYIDWREWEPRIIAFDFATGELTSLNDPMKPTADHCPTSVEIWESLEAVFAKMV